MSRFFIAAAMVALVLSSVPAGAAPKYTPAMLAPIDALIAAVNTGNSAGVAATYAPDALIVDEFPPFHWTGPKAGANWFSGYGALMKKMGMAAAHATRGTPISTKAYGTKTYLVVPVTLTYTFKGKPEKETGAWAIVLTKSGKTWLISTSAWATTSDTGE
jgi:hypothetical protein